MRAIKEPLTKNTYHMLIDRFKKAVVSDKRRRRLLFIAINIALALTALIMTVVNLCTEEHKLMVVTFIFTVLCLANAIVTIYFTRYEHILYFLFAFEALALLAFFFISGIPDGFSALWICLVPSFSMLIFGLRAGNFFSLVALGMMVFLFWTAPGKGLLQYEYGETFMLRFPFLYLSIFAISAIIEFVRMETHSRLKSANAKYEHLYRHDQLTGLYNRYGMQEYFDNLLVKNNRETTAVIMLDIDNFKHVNDTYGHECGDLVLKTIGAIPIKVMCEHSHFCRWGGEEFLLLMQCEHKPPITAEKIRSTIEQTEIRYNGQRFHVTVSIGVAIAPSKAINTKNIHNLITLADEGMYESKKAGKNRVTVKYYK